MVSVECHLISANSESIYWSLVIFWGFFLSLSVWCHSQSECSTCHLWLSDLTEQKNNLIVKKTQECCFGVSDEDKYALKLKLVSIQTTNHKWLYGKYNVFDINDHMHPAFTVSVDDSVDAEGLEGFLCPQLQSAGSFTTFSLRRETGRTSGMRCSS